MIAGGNANACDQLPLLGCTTLLDDIDQVAAIPANMRAGLTVADICPCSCAGNLRDIFSQNGTFSSKSCGRHT